MLRLEHNRESPLVSIGKTSALAGVLILTIAGQSLGQEEPGLLGAMTSGVSSQSITVTANPLWTDTGIVLTADDVLTISDAAGSWTWRDSFFGPDGDPQPTLVFDEWIRNGLHGQLIGVVLTDTSLEPNAVPRILPQDDPRLFSIGTRTVIRTGLVGRLWLGFNDDYDTDAVYDNSGSVGVNVKVEPPLRDLLAAAQAPPRLCGKVCERAQAPRGTLPEEEYKNLQAACHSCRCAQIIGHPVQMDKASETPTARIFSLTGSPPREEFAFPETYPYTCVNPAILPDVPFSLACGTGNRLGQAKWTVRVDGRDLNVYAKWIWRKKGSGAGYYNDWGKIYYRSDGYTCNFDDVDPPLGRNGDSLGEPVPGSWRAHDFPALDLTWVVKYWEDRGGLTDAQRIQNIGRDDDINHWREKFSLITGEQPGSCAGCHSAGPYIYTPFLGRLSYKGSSIAWDEVTARIDRYVYPGFDGHPRRIRTTSAAAEVLQGDPLKASSLGAFKDFFKRRSREFTGVEKDADVTAENQGPVKQCTRCHRIGSGFNLSSLSINSTGTLRAPVDRPYQPTGFRDLLREPLNPSIYHWAMWMPSFGNEPATLADWHTRYLESKMMLEFCSNDRTKCNWRTWPVAVNKLPDF